MFCSISPLHLNKFVPNFQNGACFFCDDHKRGNNPILTSKLYILFHLLIPSKWICSKLSQWGSFFMTIEKVYKSVFILYLPRYSIVSFSSFRIQQRTLHSFIVVIFGPYNAFPNGQMETFYLGECDLSDLLNMYCKVWKWYDGKKWMCATMLWRNWSLAVNIWGDIAKKLLYQLSLWLSLKN